MIVSWDCCRFIFTAVWRVELTCRSDIERALNRETIREPVEDDDLETSPKSVSAVEAIAQSRLSQEVINCLKDAEGDEKCRVSHRYTLLLID